MKEIRYPTRVFGDWTIRLSGPRCVLSRVPPGGGEPEQWSAVYPVEIEQVLDEMQSFARSWRPGGYVDGALAYRLATMLRDLPVAAMPDAERAACESRWLERYWLDRGRESGR